MFDSFGLHTLHLIALFGESHRHAFFLASISDMKGPVKVISVTQCRKRNNKAKINDRSVETMFLEHCFLHGDSYDCSQVLLVDSPFMHLV